MAKNNEEGNEHTDDLWQMKWDSDTQSRGQDTGSGRVLNKSLLMVVANTAVSLVCVRYSTSRDNDKAPRTYVYKTNRTDLNVGDLVVVSTMGSTQLALARIVEGPATYDLYNNINYQWIVDKVDTTAYDTILDLEQQAIREYDERAASTRLADARKRYNEGRL